jgi:hypothetical protein
VPCPGFIDDVCDLYGIDDCSRISELWAWVLFVWVLITTLKAVENEDWPIAHFGFAMGGFFKAIPFQA